MGIWRPATKVRFWTPKFKHAPGVRPPGLLNLISVLCILSVVGTLVYAAFRTMAAGYQPDLAEAVVVSVIHFLLPISIAYTVFTNSHLSRPLLLTYSLALAASLLFGFGYVAPVFDGKLMSSIAMLVSLGLITAWLYLSPKMRIYYALLRNRRIPKRLAARAIEYVENPWPGRRTNEILDWISEHLETLVLIGLIVTVLLAWASMEP